VGGVERGAKKWAGWSGDESEGGRSAVEFISSLSLANSIGWHGHVSESWRRGVVLVARVSSEWSVLGVLYKAVAIELQREWLIPTHVWVRSGAARGRDSTALRTAAFRVSAGGACSSIATMAYLARVLRCFGSGARGGEKCDVRWYTEGIHIKKTVPTRSKPCFDPITARKQDAKKGEVFFLLFLLQRASWTHGAKRSTLQRRAQP